MLSHAFDLLDLGPHHTDNVDSVGWSRAHHDHSAFWSTNTSAALSGRKTLAGTSESDHGNQAAHEHASLPGPDAFASGNTCRSRTSRSVAASFLNGPATSLGTITSGSRATRAAADFLVPTHPQPVRHDVSATSFLDFQGRLTELVQKAPPAVLVPLHAASIVFAVPGHLAFELGEGYLFGFQKGLALAFAGKSLGAAISFGIGRFGLGCCGALREYAKSRLEEWPAARKVANAVDKGGAFSVFVIRVAPLPCVVKNYSLALLTEIPFTVYMLASMLGLAPTTAAHVFAGTVATSAMELAHAHHSPAQVLAIACPVVAGALLSVIAGLYVHHYILNSDDAVEGLQTSSEKRKIE